MKKITINLFNLHNNFKVKFSTFIEMDPMPGAKNSEYLKVMKKFTMSGNTYITISPHSYVIIDISTKQDKGENYSSNTSFSMDRRILFFFILRLERLYRSFTEERDMFYYDNNRDGLLTVNHNISDKYTQTINVCGNKTIQMSPCVMTDEDEKQYEAIYISVNSLNYYSYVTYEQLSFLIYELRKIDFSALESSLISIALLYEDKESTELKFNNVKNEPMSLEIIDKKKKVFYEDISTIPEI